MWKLKTSILSFALFGILFIGVNSQNYNSRYDDDSDDIEYDDSLNVNDPNVCTVQVYRTGYYWKNESYSCRRYEACTPQEQAYLLRQRDCSSSYRYNSYSCRRLRNNCQVSRYTTCWRNVLRCEPRWETEKYCCSGCVPNGNGGCTRSVPCSNNNGGCSQRCTYNSARNLAVCSCLPGYRLATDGRTCIDINECATNNGGCNQKCQNIEKGFYCTCNNGFRLSTPLNCTDIQECAVGNGGCQHTCHNTRGRFYCECRPGYTRVNGFNCVDTNECLSHNGGCSDRCVNVEPGYQCECEPGRSLAADNKTCISPNSGIDRQKGALSPADDFHRADDSSLAASLGGVIGALFIIVLLLILVILAIHRLRQRNNGSSEQSAAAVMNQTYGQNTDTTTTPTVGAAETAATNSTACNVYDELDQHAWPFVSKMPLPLNKSYTASNNGKDVKSSTGVHKNARRNTPELVLQPPPYEPEDYEFYATVWRR